MFGVTSSIMQNQVLGPLSYLVTQSSSGVIVGSRYLSSPSIHSHNKSNKGQNKTSVEKQSLNTISSRNSQTPDILAIINPFECNNSAITSNKSTETIIPNSFTSKNASSNTSNNIDQNTTLPSLSNKSTHSLMKAVKSLIGDEISSAQVMRLFGSRVLDTITPSNFMQQSAVTHITKAITEACHGWKYTPESAWRVSHVSSDSFLTNKHVPLCNTSPLLKLHLNADILTRGFKTERTIERETARRQVSVRDRLRGGKVAQPAPLPENSARLKSLLEEGPEGTQKHLKMAFAEGYLAADGTGGERKAPVSRTMRFVKNFQQWLAIIVLMAVLASVMSTMGVRMNVINGNASEVQPEDITVTFEDVRGVEEAKQELEEIVEFLKCPEKFTSLGAELPKGALLVGPPGTGKTLLARAVAGEAGVPFFHAAGPEFDEILVGQGARRVRDLFRAAKGRAPCVIFIDEIDSVGAKRTNSVLHPYANQTINQLLAEMDGFHKNEGVIVLGATNRRDDLDKALLRPGRFDVEVQVPVPDLAGRREIFNYYLSKVKDSKDVEVEVLARGTTGFTGADIKNVVNQAALRAAADLVDSVTMKHLESARDKVLMGPEKKSRIPDEEVNTVTAYHEGGHTLVAHYTQHCHPLHKVTIIPRGPSLGHTAYIPAKEQYNVTRAQMLATLDSLMGGRAAEELIFGPEMVTSGASSDLKQATTVATHMVKDFGMSERVGLRTFEDTSGQLLGGGDTLSTSTKEAIDAEIKRLLTESYERARNILRTHAKEHKALAEALLKYETLDADDIKAILDGRPVSKDA